jgi:exodeoxyribonuclease VII large subunit
MLNESFAGMRVAIRGEVSGVEERRGVTYFSLKDIKEEGMLSCLIFRSDFFLQGVRLEEGQEVIVEGAPSVWKPRGRLSFRVSVVRCAGEGALKKAYDALRLKLEREGLFSLERKRAFPNFPHKIALVTSREGAAIGDFMANLGRYGFSISLFDAHVEGKRAIGDIIDGIEFFNVHPKEWDILVLIRGGGSLESLEAFNSEPLVRAVSQSKIPVLAGIGHEKDVSLAALAADAMVSTPTSTAETLGESWENARERVFAYERSCFDRFRGGLLDAEEQIHFCSEAVRNAKETLLAPLRNIERLGIRIVSEFSAWRERVHSQENSFSKLIVRSFDPMLVRKRIEAVAARIEMGNPKRLLERGYGIFRKDHCVVRSVADITLGDTLEGILSDGSAWTKVVGKE